MGEEQLVLSLVLGLVCNANHKKWKKLGGPACQGGFQTHACATVAVVLDSRSASEQAPTAVSQRPFLGVAPRALALTRLQKGQVPSLGCDTEGILCAAGQPSKAPLRCPGEKLGPMGSEKEKVPNPSAQSRHYTCCHPRQKIMKR